MGDSPTGIAQKVIHDHAQLSCTPHMYISGTNSLKKGWGVYCHVYVIGAHKRPPVDHQIHAQPQGF